MSILYDAFHLADLSCVFKDLATETDFKEMLNNSVRNKGHKGSINLHVSGYLCNV